MLPLPDVIYAVVLIFFFFALTLFLFFGTQKRPHEFILTAKMPVVFFVLFWITYEISMALAITQFIGVAIRLSYWAHIGGFVGGMLFCILLKKEVPTEKRIGLEEMPVMPQVEW